MSRSIKFITVSGLLVLSAVLAATEVSASEPVLTDKPRFRIPFRFDQAEMERLGAKEVRLYVSRDRGQHWKMAQAVQPDRARFHFDAPSDGEFWFSVRTIDNKGGMHPASNNLQPGLRVIVDQTAPQLNLQLDRTPQGRIQLSWRAQDAMLDAHTLQLEFRQGNHPQWLPVRVVPQASGQTSWQAHPSEEVSVRGSISDQAGNTANATAYANAGSGNGFGFEAIPTPTQSTKPSNWFNENKYVPAPQELDGPIAMREDRFISGNNFGDMELTPLSMGSGPMLNSQPVSMGSGPDFSDPMMMPQPMPAQNARVVNSTKFQIDYQIDDVGPSGVSSVEFYITRDSGRTWYRYGTDDDKKSPYTIEVPTEGMYGFDVRVRSGAGLADPPPQAGNTPPIAIAVDTTPPFVELLKPDQGTGENLGRILLRWTAEDEHPARESVSLAYATTPDGPWEPITSWMEDRGGFLWTVGPQMPMRVYVRVNVRDQAGNVRRVVSAEPILLDMSKPTARIIKVEPSQN
ncbi:hypothetical protein [Calycomorphotria hydatis]|nr:hypothetical protein [Calycomorphotria hydatis]